MAEKCWSAGLQVADHFNAEVVAGTIGSKQDALDYLTWTFFYRRVLQNPSYYDLDDTDPDSVSAFLSDMVERNLSLLQVGPAKLGCAKWSGRSAMLAWSTADASRLADFTWFVWHVCGMTSPNMGKSTTVRRIDKKRVSWRP